MLSTSWNRSVGAKHGYVKRHLLGFSSSRSEWRGLEFKGRTLLALTEFLAGQVDEDEWYHTPGLHSTDTRTHTSHAQRDTGRSQLVAPLHSGSTYGGVLKVPAAVASQVAPRSTGQWRPPRDRAQPQARVRTAGR